MELLIKNITEYITMRYIEWNNLIGKSEGIWGDIKGDGNCNIQFD